ncbi:MULTISPECIES: major capsid protein [Clostridium]|uniref:Phage capsid protein n=1 Tax=Clostridium novyi B str. ATCC 27606 TaxID=1443123 RepID=A0AA40IRL4_CLONO|nr:MULTISPECIES: major capsid protein [Clostridium]KEH96171.1 phage capsid protein [Clostridium botulinum D str. 16868]KEI08160.1 phage capsid protein [Clostridium novyi B str. NCTC 9691]KEI11499.1 phage capsid protein [Clostridium novyi B str. ATCC 27606]KLU74268.1 phage capsid protein [Clostridium botulinum V891]MCD3202798.1 major capsid protein [Clostridium botulinum C/D]
MDWRDIINVQEISTYIKELPPEVTIGEALFPRKKQLGMELKYIKGAKRKPVVLKQSAFDVAVKIRALKAQVDEITKQMPFFKESILVNEKDRQDLLLASQAKNKNVIDMIITKIFDNYKDLVDGGDMQMERMRMQLLSDSGTISIVSEDGDIVFDFGVPSKHKEALSGTAKWSDTEKSNPILDIIRWVRLMKDEGYVVNRAVLDAKTFGWITGNKNIIKSGWPQNPNYLASDDEIKKLIKDKTGVTLAEVSGTYKLEDGTEQPYFPSGKFTLIPTGTLGATYYGTTPEEADKMFSQGSNVEIVRTGIAVMTMKKDDPVTVQTKVSQLGMPSFERADECFFATVN